MSAGPEGLPWPDGEPGPLRSAAEDLAHAASTLGAAGGALSGAETVAGWQGLAAASFTSAASNQGSALSAGSATLGAAAETVNALAELVEQSRDKIKQMAEQVREADDAAHRAGAAATRAHHAAAAATDPPSMHGLGDAATLASGAAAAAREHARAVREKATRSARDLVDMVDQADATTAGQLGKGGPAATSGPGGLPGPTPGIEPVALAWLNTPVFVQHPDEKLNPIDLDALYRSGRYSRLPDGRRCIAFPEALRGGTGTGVPVDFEVSHYRGNAVVTYWLAYGYNNKTAFGNHQADLTRIAVEFDRRTQEPTAVWLYQHGKHQERIPYAEYQRRERERAARGDGYRDPSTGRSPAADGHPVGYNASGSHEPYDRPGHYRIGGGLATDEAASSGRAVDAGDHLRPPHARPHPAPQQGVDPHTEDNRRRAAEGLPARPVPAGAATKVGCDGGSPDEPGTGANRSPYDPGKPVETRPPEQGEGDDRILLNAIERAGTPLTLPVP